MATSSARGLRAGRATIELSLLSGGIQKQMQAMSKRMQNFGAGLTRVGAMGMAAGGAISGAFAGAARSFEQTGTLLSQMSTRTGESVSNLSKLSYAASQTGSEFDDILGAAEELNIRLGEAAREGTGPLAETFAKLGLNVQELIDLPLPERLAKIGAALNQLPDNAAKGFAADEIFGGDAFRILPLLTADIAGLTAEAERLGVVLSAEDAAAAAELSTAFTAMRAQIKAVVMQIGAAVAGPLSDWITSTQNIIATVIDWARSNRGLIAGVAAVGLALAAGGAAFIALGTTFTLLGVAIGGFLTALSAVGGILAAIVSPIGLVVGGLAGLATWFATSTEHGRVMVANLSAWFAELAATAKRIFGSITDALSMGEIGLAGEVAMAALHVAWLEGTKTIHDAWLDFKDLFMSTTIEMVHEATKEFAKITAAVKKTWTEATTLSAQIGERIGHALTASDDPNQRKYDDAASEERVQGIRAEGDAKKSTIDNDLDSQLKAIEKNRADTQAAQDKEAKDAKTAAEAARDAAMERLRQAEREVEEKRREVAREKADAVAPLAPELVKAVAAGVGGDTFKGAGGLFDTRFARQMLVGPQDQQIQLLGEIAKNTRRNNNGIPVI